MPAPDKQTIGDIVNCVVLLASIELDDDQPNELKQLIRSAKKAHKILLSSDGQQAES